jgi:transposase
MGQLDDQTALVTGASTGIGLAIARRFGPYPERLRAQFEGVIWRFRTGGQWREMPLEFGAWSTVHNRFRQWRDAGVFEVLPEGVITRAARQGEVDLSLVSVDSTTARAHHDAAGTHLDPAVPAALERAAAEEAATEKGARSTNRADERSEQTRSGTSDAVSGPGAGSD